MGPNNDRHCYEEKMISIVNRDVISALGALEDGYFDMIFADPPYNLQLKDGSHLRRPDGSTYSSTTDIDWDKFETWEEFDTFTQNWLTESYRTLKDTGSIFVSGTYHSIYRVGYMMQQLGFWFLSEIIWIKTNPMPNWGGTRFGMGHETIIWARKHQAIGAKFHYDRMKKYSGKQMRAEWKLPGPTHDELIMKNGKRLHPTQKPEALIQRCIDATTDKGDMIGDLFSGTGTTGVVAKRMQRNCVIIELNSEYIQYIRKRLQRTKISAF